MKDECDLSGCSTPEGVKKMIDDYVYYYNNERPQWTRNKMTPTEYEDYLNSLSDNEYSDYLQNEQEKYDKMMKKAREKALKRAVELGALTEEDMELYGSGKKEEQAKKRQKRRDLRIEMQLLNIQIISSLQSLQKIWMHSSIQRTSMLHFISSLKAE